VERSSSDISLQKKKGQERKKKKKTRRSETPFSKNACVDKAIATRATRGTGKVPLGSGRQVTHVGCCSVSIAALSKGTGTRAILARGQHREEERAFASRNPDVEAAAVAAVVAATTTTTYARSKRIRHLSAASPLVYRTYRVGDPRGADDTLSRVAN